MNINLLLATVGYPILHKHDLKNADKDSPLFFCQSKDLKAKGTARMTNEGFILYKGSTLVIEHSKSIAERRERVITKLLSEGIIKETDSAYILERDYNFASPSAAADLVVGYSVNGWDIWKTENGKTLDFVYRHSVEK